MFVFVWINFCQVYFFIFVHLLCLKDHYCMAIAYDNNPSFKCKFGEIILTFSLIETTIDTQWYNNSNSHLFYLLILVTILFYHRYFK